MTSPQPWLILSLILSLLTGCGGEPWADAPRPGSPATARPTVSVVNGPGEEPVFEDVTGRSGVSFVHQQSVSGTVQYLPETMGPGCALVDYDRDGHLDLFLVQGSGPTDGRDPRTIPTAKLYRGRGDSTFEDVTERSHLALRRWGMGCLFFDYDNDGLPDLFVTGFKETDRLYHQEPDHTFTDVTARMGLTDARNVWTTGAAAVDFDGDGWLDLYVCGYLDFKASDFTPSPRLVTIYNAGTNQPETLSPFPYGSVPNRLWRNLKGSSSTDVTGRAGVADPDGKSLSVLATDLDGDGWTDLFVANDVSPKALFINQRDGVFRDEAGTSWVTDIRGSMGLACGDVDGDGLLDMFCTHWIGEANALYRNTSSGPGGKGVARPGARLTFTDISEDAGLAAPSVDHVGWGCALVDLDRDGLQDILFVNGHTFLGSTKPRRLVPEQAMLFWNVGNRSFRQATLGSTDPLARLRVARGLAVGDLDEDGYPDAVVTENNGPAAILRHRGGRGTGWLGARLVGTRSNRDAVGAVVRLETGIGVLVRPRMSGDSYLCSNPEVLDFGFPAGTSIGRATVRWPAGAAEEFDPPSPGRIVTWREGAGRPVAIQGAANSRAPPR